MGMYSCRPASCQGKRITQEAQEAIAVRENKESKPQRLRGHAPEPRAPPLRPPSMEDQSVVQPPRLGPEAADFDSPRCQDQAPEPRAPPLRLLRLPSIDNQTVTQPSHLSPEDKDFDSPQCRDCHADSDGRGPGPCYWHDLAPSPELLNHVRQSLIPTSLQPFPRVMARCMQSNPQPPSWAGVEDPVARVMDRPEAPTSQRGAAEATIGKIALARDVLRYRAKVLWFAGVDLVLTIIYFLGTVNGFSKQLFLLAFVFGPICGILGARFLDRSQLVIFQACSLVKIGFEVLWVMDCGLSSALGYCFFVFIVLVQCWSIQITAMLWSTVGLIDPTQRRALAGPKDLWSRLHKLRGSRVEQTAHSAA